MCSCHNRATLTKRSLNSISHILKNTRLVDKFHFFVLDDCSTDETYSFLNKFENTSVVKSNENLYWAGGMNYCYNHYYEELTNYDLFIPFNEIGLFISSFMKLSKSVLACLIKERFNI